MTCGDLTEVAASSAEQMAKKLERWMSYLRGSVGWKKNCRNQLSAMIHKMGRLPTLFITWSAADMQWMKLQSLLHQMATGEILEDVDDEGRVRRVIDDPGTCSLYFDKVMH